MKPSVRPLFSILVVAVFAATLVSRSFLLLRRPPPPPLFNSTFLRCASIDLAEPKSKQHIHELLQGNFTSVPWLRRHTSPPPHTAVPSIFRSPRLNRLWLDFMTLLQDWSRKKSFHPEVMSELVRLVKHPLDRLNGVPVPDHRRFSSCAVVGNSGILLNSSHGSLIDSHEMVVRLNNARIKPFERDVGSKTSLSFVNSNILHHCAQRQRCFCHPYGPGVPLLMYICQPIHLLDFSLCNSTHGGPLLITDPRFDVLCARIVKYYSVRRFVEGAGRAVEEWASAHEGSLFHYSSGVQAVMLALGVCERVSMFGFGKSDSAKHHYHTNQKAELSLHDYEAEYALYADLVRSPRLIPFISDRFKFPPVVMYQ